MKEALSLRNRVLVGVLTGALAVGGCGGSTSSSPNKEARSQAAPSKAPELQAGDNIKDVRLIDIKPTKTEKKFILDPNSSHSEDLGVVFNQNLSKSLLATMGDQDPDHAVGILLTERAGQPSFSFIFFEHQSGVIAHISSSQALEGGSQPLFGFGEGSSYYQISVEPTPTGAVLVSCDPSQPQFSP